MTKRTKFDASSIKLSVETACDGENRPNIARLYLILDVDCTRIEDLRELIEQEATVVGSACEYPSDTVALNW